MAGPSDPLNHAMVTFGPLLGSQRMLLDSPFCDAHACALLRQATVVREDEVLVVERSHELAEAPGVLLDEVLQPAAVKDMAPEDSSLRVTTIAVRVPALRASLVEVVGTFADDLVTHAFVAVVASTCVCWGRRGRDHARRHRVATTTWRFAARRTGIG